MHISSISYTEGESIEHFYADGLKKWARREQSVTVFLKEDDDPNKADELAKQFVKEKLGSNTVNYSDEGLPVIQVDKGIQLKDMTLEEQIRSCKDIKTLKVYESMVKKTPALQKAYNDTMDAIQFHKM